jgi:hypothetical protein
MACEHFEDDRLTRCRAVAGMLIPSHFEREQYCRTDGSRTCPTARLYALGGSPVPQEAYYALWLPQPERGASELPKPIVTTVSV